MIQTIITLSTGEFIVDFQNDDERTLILQSNTQERQDLFSFCCEKSGDTDDEEPGEQKAIRMLDSSKPDEGCRVGVFAKITAMVRDSSDNDCVIDLDVDFDPKATCNSFEFKKTKEGILPCGISFHYDTLSLVLLRNKNIRQLSAEINLHFKYHDTINGEPATRETVLKIYVTPGEYISDAVIDFGSEATQMLVCQREKTQSYEHIANTYRMIYRQLKNDLPTDDCEDYEQYGGETLYKSIFYAKKDIPELDADTVTPTFGEPNALLKILTKHDESAALLGNKIDSEAPATYLRVPNIKLSRFGSVAQPKINDEERISEFGDNYFYRNALNNFLLAALSSANKKTKAIIIYVLMPNVYLQQDIWENLAYIRKDIKDILKKNAERLSHIRHVQVESLSESDASILGVFTAFLYKPDIKTPPKKGNYLILDGGKGTLDYSIMQVNKPKFTHLYKGGIIGSGAALTTAYTIALLYDFAHDIFNKTLDENDIIETLYQKILGVRSTGTVSQLPNLGSLGELIDAVERYKLSLNKKGVTPAEITISKGNTEKGITLDSFINFIKAHIKDDKHYKPLSAEAQKYVDRVTDAICEAVTDDLEIYLKKSKEQIDGIIFAGRAFNHRQFKESMLTKLRDKKFISPELKDRDDFIQGRPDLMKIICLYSSAVLRDGNYSQISAQSLNDPSDTLAEIEDEKPTVSRRIFNSIKGIMGKPKKKATESIKKIKEDIGGYHRMHARMIVTGSESALAQGIDIMYDGKADHIIVAGSTYKVPQGVKTGIITLYFTSDSIIIIDGDQKLHTLKRPDVDLRSSKLTLPTMFPYIYGINYDLFHESLYSLIENKDNNTADAPDSASTDNPEAAKAEEKADAPSPAAGPKPDKPTLTEDIDYSKLT